VNRITNWAANSEGSGEDDEFLSSYIKYGRSEGDVINLALIDLKGVRVCGCGLIASCTDVIQED